MSTSVNPPAPDATPVSSPSTGVPGPRASSTAGGPAGPTADPAPTAGNGVTGARLAVVVVVSVVLSVVASASVVALMDSGDEAVQPAAVVQQDQGQDAGQDAVEQGASRELTQLADRRADTFCPHGAYPAVAC